jgi:hypothetical protein
MINSQIQNPDAMAAMVGTGIDHAAVRTECPRHPATRSDTNAMAIWSMSVAMAAHAACTLHGITGVTE